MKKKRTWSSMAKRTACILTALCVTAAAVPGTGGYNYNEVFAAEEADDLREGCLLYTSPSPRDGLLSRMPSSA